ncbi:hypothetical protein [Streptomyces sp. NBC_00162]|uniref:hypothetical protein n=1 Tax=Streptomyces sp. NBC_00162 TaxID=2903629 RepID=UPI00214BA181|nr:hypothetical protein [Streptomyces sp. NBC_00162]UUU43958.1 hypothetical protein JIW86_37220 [Streptomyces sp. NBC_00162]
MHRRQWQGQLRWRGWGKASMFARAEVRRPKPASTTLDQLVAITNPVWFYSAQLPPYDVERRALFHTERRPDGSWSSMRPLPGAAVAGSGSGSGSFAGFRAPWPAWRTARSWCWASRPTTVCG